MPIYEYRCHECGAKFERLVRMFGTAETKCPKCGSEQTEKLFSAFAVQGGASSDGLGSGSGSSCGTGGFS